MIDVKRWVPVVLLVGFVAVPVIADVAVVVEHQWTVNNNFFSAFGINPATNEICSMGYGNNNTLRWSHILDDTVEPWDMEGHILMTTDELDLFVREGFPSNSGSFSAWGMTFSPINEKYLITGIGKLEGPSGPPRIDEEVDMIIMDPDLPNSLIPPYECGPNQVTVSNVGGVYRLIDSSINTNGTSRAAFISSGVQVGDNITIYPTCWDTEVISATYHVTAVVSETELLVDEDPCWYANQTVPNAGYLMMMQSHLTLGTFRDEIDYFADNPTQGPKANKKGGLSPDGTTYYVADIISDNLLAVDSQTRETFSVFVSNEQYRQYVLDQIAAGRHLAIVRPDKIYTEGLDGDWNDASVDTTLNFSNQVDVQYGLKSLAATFDAAGAEIDFYMDDGEARAPQDYTGLRFYIHGAGSGGQTMDVGLFNSNGVGSSVTVPVPTATEWLQVDIPLASFSVVDDVYRIVFSNTAAGAQPMFYLDEIGLMWSDPLPEGIADYNTNGYSASGYGAATGQTACDEYGNVWFSEVQTDDLLWTSDGVTINTFMTADEVVQAYIEQGAFDPYTYAGDATNAVQYMGLIVDDMGTIYWSDNFTDSIWKMPACGGTENIIQAATKQEIQTALGFTSSPRGLENFTIRGHELLTFNFVDSNTIFKVDMNTFDYGDFDGDFDVDADDYGLLFPDCIAGPGITEAPVACTNGFPEAFEWCDLDHDGDVDMQDYSKFQQFVTEP